MKRLSCGLLCAMLGGLALAAPAHQCAAPAVVQASKLLTFHFGADGRIEVEPGAKLLSPVKNPAGTDQYDALEVWGNIYKGRYRMRFIYAQLPGECLLMGQEILEYAKL